MIVNLICAVGAGIMLAMFLAGWLAAIGEGIARQDERTEVGHAGES